MYVSIFKRRPLAPAIIAIVSSLLLLSGCSREGGKQEVPRPVVEGVRVGEAEVVGLPEYFEASGTVRPRTVSTVSSRVTGQVSALHASEGDRVVKGQMLLSIDQRDLRARVRAAERAVEEARGALEAASGQRDFARSTYDRYLKLYGQQVVSEQEKEEMETRLRVAEAQHRSAKAALDRAGENLKEARLILGFSDVRSPVDGVVASRLIEEGSLALPGTPLFVVEDTSSHRLEVSVDERHLGGIAPAEEVDVSFLSLGRDIRGKVSEVVQSVDPQTRTFLVKVDVEDPEIRSGMYGKAKFPVGTMKALSVPAASLVGKGQLRGVYVVAGDGSISYRLVREGKRHGDMVEILSGLEPGERLIVEGADRAADGGVLGGRR